MKKDVDYSQADLIGKKMYLGDSDYPGRPYHFEPHENLSRIFVRWRKEDGHYGTDSTSYDLKAVNDLFNRGAWFLEGSEISNYSIF